jgi:hypothetical protein
MNAIAVVDLHEGRDPDTDRLVTFIETGGWRVERHDGRSGRLPGGTGPVVVTGGHGAPDCRGIWRIRLQAAMGEWAQRRPLMAIGLAFPILAAAMRWPVRRLDADRRGWHPVTQTADGLNDPVLSVVPQGASVYEDRPWTVLPPPAATVSAKTVLSYSSAGDVAAARFGPQAIGLAFHPVATDGRPPNAVPAEILTRFVALTTATKP